MFSKKYDEKLKYLQEFNSILLTRISDIDDRINGLEKEIEKLWEFIR